LPNCSGNSFKEYQKGKITPVFNYALYHEDIWGSGDIAPPFFIPAVDGGELKASCPCRFTPAEIAFVLIGREAGSVPESVWPLWR
jgi:hypothetical protein